MAAAKTTRRRQADAGPVLDQSGPVAPGEGFEQGRQPREVYAGAGVAHRQPDLRIQPPRLDQRRPAGAVVADGVENQAGQHLLQDPCVGLDRQPRLQRRRPQVDAGRLGLAGQGMADAPRDQQGIQPLARQWGRRGRAGEGHQPLHQREKPARPVPDALERLELAMAEGIAGLVHPQQIGEAQHDVQRPAHLAADGAEQARVGAAGGGLDRLGPQQARLDLARRRLQIGDAPPGGGRLAVVQTLDGADPLMCADGQPCARDSRRQGQGERQ